MFSDIFIADEVDEVWDKGSAYFTDDFPGKKAKLVVFGLLYSNTVIPRLTSDPANEFFG